ncbi:MAG: CoA transferase [Dehalococcoidales bacterium]|nr:CoA transferase [Dehalococcoidales bacterium]
MDGLFFAIPVICYRYEGFFCGKILGDLGVDVIKVERPGGDPARNRSPFYQDKISSETSLFWLAYNVNKRGITLDIERQDGQEIFKHLVMKSDIVIESFPCGYLNNLGLGYSELNKINPRIIMASITPFGATGPYKDYKSCELVNMAMSGLMNLSGDPDRAPVIISFPHACLNASSQAAVALLGACYWREESGKGQYIDVAIRESIIQMIAQTLAHWEINRVEVHRAGQFRIGWGPGLVRQIWPCKDGFVIFLLGGGRVRSKPNQALVEWMDSEGLASEYIKKINWEEFDMANVTEEIIKSVEDAIYKFFISHTKNELFEGGLKMRVDVYPVNDPKDIAEQIQLKARNYWTEVEHPELGAKLVYPGDFVKSSEMRIGIKPAPRIGEHNPEIYIKELGFSEKEFATLKQSGVV